VPYKAATVAEMSHPQSAPDFLDVMVPSCRSEICVTLFESAGYDFAAELNLRAFEVTLELQETGQTLIPGSDLDRDQTAGDDFFVAVQTSAQTRALDSFMVLIPDEGIEIKNNYGLSPSLKSTRPSLAYLDPTVGDQSIQPLTVRPEPVVVVDDLTKKQARSRTLPLEGAGPVPVLAFNMADYGMSTHVVPQSQSVDDYGIYFNQGYIWDSLLLNFIPVNSFERNDLREITKQSFYSNNTVFYGHGVGIFVDDDTPIGDLLDNDGDGLIDEELRNGRDDDLDGVVDEEDWGDNDDAGVNGVFDSLDYDNFWPPLAPVRNRYVNFTNEAEYATTPVFDNVAEPDGSYQASFELEANRMRVEALDPYDFINDPWTYSPQFLFIRTGYSPIWYDPTPTVSDFALTNPNNLTPQGCYVTLGNDEEDYQELIDIWQDAGRANTLETTYHHAFPIPDEDGGEGFEFLEGDDVFVVLRASGTAEEGDSFRVQVPRDAFGFSVYQSPAIALNVDNAGNRSFPVSLPNEQNLSDVITIGAGGRPPQVTVVSPGEGVNYFDTEYAYTVKFSVVDPDSINGKVNIYLDNNALGFDGIQLNTNPLTFTQTKYAFSLKDPAVFAKLQQRFGIASIQRLTEQDRFYVYIEADDLVTEKVRVYSDGYLTIDKENVEDLAAYLKLDRNGTIYSIGVDQQFLSVPVEEGAAAVDLEVLPEENGVLVLREDGKVYGRKVQGTALGLYEDYWTHSWDLNLMGLIQMPKAPAWRPGSRAVDLEIVPETPGYYILDQFGFVTGYGALRDFAWPAFGWDIARDMELTSSGEGLYILDGYGEVHVLGEAPSYSEQVPYQGFDIASDLTLTPSENGYYILTKNGTVVRQGDAAALSIPGATSNVLVDLGLMGLEYTPNAEGFLVMGASGEVTPLLNARLGPDFALNPEENNFTDIEVVGLTAGNAEELIREYFEAYSKEDIDRICALLADDYFDDHYNDCALLTKSLRQVFDYYMIGLPTENPMSIENVEIQVSSGEAIVTADVVISFRYPSFQALAVGDVLTLTIPYNQTVQMVELGDGRNDQLSVYDLDNPEGYFDPAIPQRDRKIFEKTFTKAGVEGPYKLYLKYEGVGQNSAYVFTLADGVNYGILQPADVRIGHYPPETIFHATDTVQFKFTLEREGNRGFLIQKAPLLQMLRCSMRRPIRWASVSRGAARWRIINSWRATWMRTFCSDPEISG
jgi:hypothetical protein